VLPDIYLLRDREKKCIARSGNSLHHGKTKFRCFVIKHWGSRTAKATVTVADQTLPSGPDFRQGVIIDTDGTPPLAVWIRKVSESPVRCSVIEVLQMSGR